MGRGGRGESESTSGPPTSNSPDKEKGGWVMLGAVVWT